MIIKLFVPLSVCLFFLFFVFSFGQSFEAFTARDEPLYLSWGVGSLPGIKSCKKKNGEMDKASYVNFDKHMARIKSKFLSRPDD